jgi:hypothetical protein
VAFTDPGAESTMRQSRPLGLVQLRNQIKPLWRIIVSGQGAKPGLEALMRLRQSVLATCTLIPGLALAQPSLDSWDNLRQLRVGQKIEVVDAKMKPHQGEFLGHSTDSVRLRVGKDEVSVPREDVISVKNREAPRRGRNALLGLGIGTGVGAALPGTQTTVYRVATRPTL